MSKIQLSPPKREFRTDINGLRAWAVVAVILYHFGVSGFGGGFVGVDIFFVISGFLMTSIIVTGLESGRGFSLLKFYLARAKRILPALIALCGGLLVFGWFFLAQGEYTTLARHATSTLTFSSNSTFWKESGYFDVASYDKWLLHTWSLSVEWQFYLILPLILMTVWKLRLGRTSALAVLSIVAMASLAASVFFSSTYPSTAFYLLPMRAWEMLSGGLIFLIVSRYPIPKAATTYVELLGFALIIYSIALIDPSVTWPGWRALIPVTGTTLIIATSNQGSLLTRPAVLQWLGNRSYSLYLWHWPIVAALVFVELRQEVSATIVGLLLTVVLGHISYVVIESKSRGVLAKQGTWAAYGTVFVALMLTALPSYLIERDDGVPTRAIARQVSKILKDAAVRNPRIRECFINGKKTVPECSYGGTELGAIVIGDSHAAAVIRAVWSDRSQTKI